MPCGLLVTVPLPLPLLVTEPEPPKVKKKRTEHGPKGWGGILSNHTVMEHEDGSITVTPSILIGPAGDSPGWHGFLERGVFREC